MKTNEIDRNENFPGSWFDRKAVCKRCKVVILDGEPSEYGGDFYHPVFQKGRASKCPNQGKTFTTEDKEIEPFVRKSVRRHLKREKQKL